MKTIKEPARDIPVRAEADVLVVGGGPAGIMAAEAAAGDGLRVMLVESRGFLGGNLTIGLPILGFLGRKGNQIIEGSAQRFIDRLRARGAASEHRPCKNHMSLTIIDEEEVKRTALEIMEEKGVEVLLYTFFADAIREGDQGTTGTAGVWMDLLPCDITTLRRTDGLSNLSRPPAPTCAPTGESRWGTAAPWCKTCIRSSGTETTGTCTTARRRTFSGTATVPWIWVPPCCSSLKTTR